MTLVNNLLKALTVANFFSYLGLIFACLGFLSLLGAISKHDLYYLVGSGVVIVIGLSFMLCGMVERRRNLSTLSQDSNRESKDD